MLGGLKNLKQRVAKMNELSKDFFYEPCKPGWWNGRDDGIAAERIYQKIQHGDFKGKPVKRGAPAIGLLGFCSDQGVFYNKGRRGAYHGPESFRKAIGGLSSYEIKHLLLDFGNVCLLGPDLNAAQEDLGDKVKSILDLGLTPFVIGGGHETSWGHFLGLKEHMKGKKWGILNFDAHLDLRPLPKELKGQGTSGTPFRQIAQWCEENGEEFHYFCLGVQKNSNTPSLFSYAKEKNVQMVFAEDLQKDLDKSLSQLELWISKLDAVYVTFCLDVMNSALVQGVSAPAPLGLQYSQVQPFLKLMACSQKAISWDVVELSPPFDKEGLSAAFAASLGAEIIRSLSLSH